MHNEQNGSDIKRLTTIKALLSPDEARDKVLERFVNLASRAGYFWQLHFDY